MHELAYNLAEHYLDGVYAIMENPEFKAALERSEQMQCEVMTAALEASSPSEVFEEILPSITFKSAIWTPFNMKLIVDLGFNERVTFRDCAIGACDAAMLKRFGLKHAEEPFENDGGEDVDCDGDDYDGSVSSDEEASHV